MQRFIKITAIMIKKLLSIFLCLISIGLSGCSGLSQPDVSVKGDEPSVILDALRDGMVRLGLDEKTIDCIIEERKGWEVAE